MSNLQKMDDFLNNLEFENDFGESPILLGRLTQDKAFITVASLGLGFAAWAIAQAPLAIVVGLIAWNDLVSLGEGRTKTKKTPPVIDTEAEPVYEDEQEFTPSQETPRREKRDSKKESPRRSSQEASTPTQEPEEEEEEIQAEWRWAGYRDDIAKGKTTDWIWGGDAEHRSPVEDSAPRRKKKERSSPPGETGATPRLPQVTKRSQRELIGRLKEECPALLKLVKSHPVRAVGVQRAGKSTLVKKLTLLRMVLLDGHRAIASTPHYEPANPYPNVFQVVGITPNGKRDYPAIRRQWEALAQRIEDCRIGNTTTIWDEFGLMDKVLEEDEIKSVLTSCLRETMKFGEYPIFVLHGETTAFMPGSKGLATVILNSTVRVEAIGEPIEDEDGLETIKPTGRFHITWLDGSQEEGQIPEWLTEKYLLDMLGNPVVEHSEPEPEDEGSRLQEPLKTIYLYAKKQNEWVTVREVQRKDFAVLKGKGAKNIRQYFGLLADTGLGEIEEEGKSDSAVSFLAK